MGKIDRAYPLIADDLGLALRLKRARIPLEVRSLDPDASNRLTRATYHGDRSVQELVENNPSPTSDEPKTFEYYPHGSFYPVKVTLSE